MAQQAQPQQLPADMLENYVHSPVHLAVAQADSSMLRGVLSKLPQPPAFSEVVTEVDSILAANQAELASSVIDYRGVPGRETPLYLAVRLGNAVAVEMLLAAGADCGLQNSQGWTAIQEAVCTRKDALALLIIKHRPRIQFATWNRHIPRFLAQLRRSRDFYMEINFHFESSVIPFISRIAPSDTFKIWKRGANLRVDITLDSFDRLRIQRSDRTILYMGEEGKFKFLLLTHKNKDVKQIPVEDDNNTLVADRVACAQLLDLRREKKMSRAGLDVTQAVLKPHLTWRRQEKTEVVCSWKTKVYDMHNVCFSLRMRKILGENEENEENEDEEHQDINEFLTEEEKQQLKEARGITDEAEQKNGKRDDKLKTADNVQSDATSGCLKEYKKSLHPVLWLTQDFPLDTEELLPLLDILANKVKAIRRIREVLTTKLPPGTFPVKMAIPLIPTVRVIVTFTKFEDLADTNKPAEQQSAASGSWFSRKPRSAPVPQADPFMIPSDYKDSTSVPKEKKPSGGVLAQQ